MWINVCQGFSHGSASLPVWRHSRNSLGRRENPLGSPFAGKFPSFLILKLPHRRKGRRARSFARAVTDVGQVPGKRELPFDGAPNLINRRIRFSHLRKSNSHILSSDVDLLFSAAASAT